MRCLASRLGDLEVATDLARQEVVDFSMSRDRRDPTLLGIEVDRMAAAFPEEAAALRFQMPNEVDALHAAGLSRESERFANDGRAGEIFLGEGAVGLED